MNLGTGHLNPIDIGHARSTAVHVSKHGNNALYADEKGGSEGLRGVADGSIACSADTGFCALFPESEDASEQRGKNIVHNHLRYACWQSAQPTSGLYWSRPHGNVVRDTVKFVRTSIRGCVTESGSVLLSWIVPVEGP